MGRGLLRLGSLLEYLRGALWFLPSLLVSGSFVLGAVLSRVRVDLSDVFLSELLFAGEAEGARAVLQVVAGTMVTITSLVFSLTIVALQLAASTYSPRVLSQLMRDRGNQVVLGVFLGTFAYSYAVLRTVSSSSGGEGAFVPELAVSVLLPFVFASLVALVYFIHHVARLIRVDSILQSIEEETAEIIDEVYPVPQGSGDVEVRGALPSVPPDAEHVPVPASGYVQAFGEKELVRLLAERRLFVQYRPRVGEHAVRGTPLAWVWGEDGDAAVRVDDEVRGAVEAAVELGETRTLREDVSFGLRQLVDVAIRALSPGVNDPTTAVQAIHRLSMILGTLTSRPLLARLGRDDAGVVRVSIPAPTFGDLLDLACRQIRTYGSRDVVVVTALLRMLEDVGALAPTAEARSLVRTQIADVLRAAEAGLTLDADQASARAAGDEALRTIDRPATRVGTVR